MFDKVVFSERLDDILKSRHLKQEMIAEGIGRKQSIISRMTNNENESIPKADVVYDLCKYLNVSADYLLGISDLDTVDKDLKGVCEYTGLSVEAVKTVMKTRPKADSIFSSLKMLDAINYMLVNGIDILWCIYNYLFTDFEFAYIDSKQNTSESITYHSKGDNETEKQHFPSEQIRFIGNSINDEYATYSYSLTKDEYAEVLLQRLCILIRNLRMKNLKKEKRAGGNTDGKS